MTDAVPPDDPRAGSDMRAWWFDGKTPDEQDDIIRPAFEAENPTDSHKIRVKKEWRKDMGK